MLQISAIKAEELSGEHIDAWGALQRQDEDLASPHFRAELVQQVAAVRPNIEVAVLRQSGEYVGFLPYFRHRRRHAQPPADRFSDLQGAIVRRDVRWEMRDVLQSCGLASWLFRDWLATQRQVEPWLTVRAEAPYMDLSQGFEAYCDQRREAGSYEVRDLLRKTRKFEREIGPLRLEPYCTDQAVLDQLLQWKRELLQRQRKASSIDVPWAAPLMSRLLHVRSDEFAGMLSAMYVGSDLVAVNMGVRSATVLNGWVSAYNMQYSRYSPGQLLFIAIARMAPELGIKRIDLGRGDEPFKESMRSAALAVGDGAVDRRAAVQQCRAALLRTKEWLRRSPIGEPTKRLVRQLRYGMRRSLGRA